MGALYSLFSSVEQAGLTQRSIVRRLEIQADGVVATRLGLEESTPLVYLERLRLAGEEPLALDRVWIPATIGSPLLDVDFTHTSLYEELAARSGVRLKGGEEQIRATMPTTAERELLQVPPTAAVFAIEREGRSGVQVVEWRQTVVRGDRFVLRADFSASGYRLTVGSSATTAPRPTRTAVG